MKMSHHQFPPRAIRRAGPNATKMNHTDSSKKQMRCGLSGLNRAIAHAVTIRMLSEKLTPDGLRPCERQREFPLPPESDADMIRHGS